MSDRLLQQIEELARTHVGTSAPLSTDARLVEDLGLDSLQRLTLAVEIENRFRICLDPEDEAQVETVGDLVAIVRRKSTASEESSG